LNGAKKLRPHLQNKKFLADLKEARKWVVHFEERGNRGSVWHKILARLEAELRRVSKPKKEPKVEETKDGT